MAIASKTGTVQFQPSDYYLMLSQDTFRLDKDNAFVGGSTLTVTAKKRTNAVGDVGYGEVLITVTPDSGTAKTSTSGSLSFSVTSSMSKITVTLTDTAKIITHDQRTVMVVRDGLNGSQGATGKTGASFYMAGSYSATTSYTRDAYKAPVVELDGLYYAQIKEGTIVGINPKTDAANNGGNWVVFDMFKYIFSEVAFIKFGKLGSAVFNGDFMMSEYGVNSNGTLNNNYEKFDATLADPTTNSNFMPNILMNLSNGEAWMQNVHVRGEINDITETSLSVSGTVQGSSLSSTLTTLLDETGIHTKATSDCYAAIDLGLTYGVVGDTSCYRALSISNTSTYGGAMMCGLYMDINSSDYGMVVNGGSTHIISSGLTRIQGLSLYGIKNTSGTLSSTVDFILASGNITLPSASTVPGKIVFVKMGGNYTISSSSTIVKSSGSGTYTSESFDNRALFFVSNGSKWYEFTCYTR